jgi:transcriptional regulator with XRE-family HTH domain
MDKIIGKNLKRLREHFDLTQEALAKHLGINRVELSYYENGTRTMPTALMSKVATFFSVDECDLYEESDTVENNVKIALAFRANNFEDGDLQAIESFKKIALNYLKMKQALNRDE